MSLILKYGLDVHWGKAAIDKCSSIKILVNYNFPRNFFSRHTCIQSISILNYITIVLYCTNIIRTIGKIIFILEKNIEEAKDEIKQCKEELKRAKVIRKNKQGFIFKFMSGCKIGDNALNF